MRRGPPLPRLLIILDKAACRQVDREVVSLAADLLEAGARFLWYRNTVDGAGVQLEEVTAVARRVAKIGAELVVGDRADVALSAGASGVHLPGHGLPVPSARTLPGIRRVGRSCHDLTEVALAEQSGADYVTLSPIFPTVSEKSTPRKPLGIGALRAASATATTPIFALGGITPERVADCLAAGTYGVAVLGAVVLAEAPVVELGRFRREIKAAQARVTPP